MNIVMPRRKRTISSTGIYHWIARGVNRKNLFHRHEDYLFFLGLIHEYRDHFKTQIYHYCLMTNHIHLLIYVQEFENLVGFSHYLKRRYAYYHSKTYKVTGATFERMYRSKAVEEGVYLLECARYIDRNPLRAGLVERLADYPYSSYRSYANGFENKIITKSPAYLELAETDLKRQAIYTDYVSKSRPQEEFANPSLIGV